MDRCLFYFGQVELDANDADNTLTTEHLPFVVRYFCKEDPTPRTQHPDPTPRTQHPDAVHTPPLAQSSTNVIQAVQAIDTAEDQAVLRPPEFSVAAGAEELDDGTATDGIDVHRWTRSAAAAVAELDVTVVLNLYHRTTNFVRQVSRSTNLFFSGKPDPQTPRPPRISFATETIKESLMLCTMRKRLWRREERDCGEGEENLARGLTMVQWLARVRSPMMSAALPTFMVLSDSQRHTFFYYKTHFFLFADLLFPAQKTKQLNVIHLQISITKMLL